MNAKAEQAIALAGESPNLGLEEGSMPIRYVKIALVASVALWGLSSGVMNLTYYSLDAVFAVLSVEGRESIRDIANPITASLGYAFIYLSKFTVFLVCGVAAWRMYQSRMDLADFNKAKITAFTGCAFGVLFLFFGFYVLANGVFGVGGPSELNSAYLSHALYYIGAIGIIGLMVISDSDNYVTSPNE